jgi:hypothetical protein
MVLLNEKSGLRFVSISYYQHNGKTGSSKIKACAHNRPFQRKSCSRLEIICKIFGPQKADIPKTLSLNKQSGGFTIPWSPLTSPTKTSSDMTRPTVTLYAFLGVHSFLIGLFPFYIPVFLYKTGFSLSRICAFIAVTALGFVITLYPWERMVRQVSLIVLILI